MCDVVKMAIGGTGVAIGRRPVWVHARPPLVDLRREPVSGRAGVIPSVERSVTVLTEVERVAVSGRRSADPSALSVGIRQCRADSAQTGRWRPTRSRRHGTVDLHLCCGPRGTRTHNPRNEANGTSDSDERSLAYRDLLIAKAWRCYWWLSAKRACVHGVVVN